MNAVFKYDVALSYAGEDRSYAADLARRLRRAGVSVFFDRHQAARLWGKELPEYLHRVYWEEARYCVMFVSKHYARKRWTIHERRAAQARAAGATDDYILPVRIDDTIIDGLSPGIAYQDVRQGMQKICDLLLTKLEKAEHDPTPVSQRQGGVARQGLARQGVFRRERATPKPPDRGVFDPGMGASSDKPNSSEQRARHRQGITLLALGGLVSMALVVVPLSSVRKKAASTARASSQPSVSSLESRNDVIPAPMSFAVPVSTPPRVATVERKSAGSLVSKSATEVQPSARRAVAPKQAKTELPKKPRTTSDDPQKKRSSEPCADPQRCSSSTPAVDKALREPAPRQAVPSSPGPPLNPASFVAQDEASSKPPLNLHELRSYEAKF